MCLILIIFTFLQKQRRYVLFALDIMFSCSYALILFTDFHISSPVFLADWCKFGVNGCKSEGYLV